MREPQLLDEAIRATGETAGVRIEPIDRADEGERVKDLRLRVWIGEAFTDLRAMIKPNVNNVIVAQLAHRFHPDRENRLLVTRHVTPTVAGKLRDLGIQFIDVAGNAHLRLPGAYVYIQGNKLPEHWQAAPTFEHLWTQAGVKVVFALLRDPEMVKAPYRVIAGCGRVALGTVATVMRTLIHKGFVDEGRAEARYLTRRKELLDTWAVAYAERLRPKTLVGRFQFKDDLADLEDRVKDFGACWGGEVAAARLTGYLKPEVYTLYADAALPRLIVALRLAHDARGKVELRRVFWRPMTQDKPGTAPDILVYADLLATADARNVEAAHELYDRHIRGHLGLD